MLSSRVCTYSMELNSFHTLIGTPRVWREPEQCKMSCQAPLLGFVPQEEEPPPGPTAARVPVPPGPEHGAWCPCALQQLSDLLGAALSPSGLPCLPSRLAAQGTKGLFPSMWGHQSPSVCKLSLPPALNPLPNFQPGNLNNCNVLIFLHIALKIKLHFCWRYLSQAQIHQVPAILGSNPRTRWKQNWKT